MPTPVGGTFRMDAGISTRSAIHASGLSGPQLAQIIVANAVQVFNAGAMALKPVGIQIGALYAAQIQQMYSRPGSGKKNKKKDGSSHRASAPGQPPAPDTGELRDSVRFTAYRKPGNALGTGKFVKGFGKTEIVIYTRNKYAATLEGGSKGKGKQIAARPAWRPVHLHWRGPKGRRHISGLIMFGKPDNFLQAERRHAARLTSANPRGTIGREVAGRR